MHQEEVEVDQVSSIEVVGAHVVFEEGPAVASAQRLAITTKEST